jgi:hypothetical protein
MRGDDFTCQQQRRNFAEKLSSDTAPVRSTAQKLEATRSFWRGFIKASVVMAKETLPSGSQQREDSLGALKEPPRLRK